MEFQVGQVFISIKLPNWGAQGAIKIIAPIGSHMLAIDIVIDTKSENQLDAKIVVYEKGDKDAEESAIS